MQLFLLNPRWVAWFNLQVPFGEKCFAQDDKSDQKTPYYIAERMRTHRPRVAWSPQMDILPLRFYTPFRFHLVQTLAREKCYFSAFLFLKASAYHRLKPFSDVFGAASRLVLTQLPSLDELAELPVEVLTTYLHQLSGHHLPHPAANARKLQRVERESFSLDIALALLVQRILELTLEHIRFLEGRIQHVEDWIAAELLSHPAIPQLATIPGPGPVFSSGIGAAIRNVQRFLQGPKWNQRGKRYRPRNLRDAEDAVAKLAGFWWPRSGSGDFEAEDRRIAKIGNRYLRYYFIQGTDRMRHNIPDYADFYARKYREATKHKHKRALVLTARRSVGLVVGPHRPGMGLHRNRLVTHWASPIAPRRANQLTAHPRPVPPCPRQTASPGPSYPVPGRHSRCWPPIFQKKSTWVGMLEFVSISVPGLWPKLNYCQVLGQKRLIVVPRPAIYRLLILNKVLYIVASNNGQSPGFLTFIFQSGLRLDFYRALSRLSVLRLCLVVLGLQKG